MTEDEFRETCYQPIKERLKSGNLDKFNKEDLKKIDRWVVRHRGASTLVKHPEFGETTLQGMFLQFEYNLSRQVKLRTEKAPLFYKALAMSLDFREYVGRLSDDHKTRLSRIAKALLREIQKPVELLTDTEKERLKEQIRLLCVYANQLYRDGDPKVLSTIDTLKTVIAKRLGPNYKCRTVRGSLHYLEGKVLRNQGRYSDCEKAVSEAIEVYTDWTRDNREPNDLALANYKNAMSLGTIAWCKNMRGFNRDALNLINAARLLIRPTTWELDKAHLDMIYADIKRTFLGRSRLDRLALSDAIKIAQRSYVVFDTHPHKRLRSRAAFTLALLNFYAENYPRSEQLLMEVEAYSREQHEARWHSNALILQARIKNKKEEYPAALDLLSKAIDEAKGEGVYDRVVVACIVKGESHLGLTQYQEAVNALLKAQKVNDQPGGKHEAVNSERNKGWICLVFASVYWANGELAQSRYYLDEWHKLRGIRYQVLTELAADLELKHQAALSDFVIGKDVENLKWLAHRSALAKWLTERATLRTNSNVRKTLAKELGISPKALSGLIGADANRRKKT